MGSFHLIALHAPANVHVSFSIFLLERTIILTAKKAQQSSYFFFGPNLGFYRGLNFDKLYYFTHSDPTPFDFVCPTFIRFTIRFYYFLNSSLNLFNYGVLWFSCMQCGPYNRWTCHKKIHVGTVKCLKLAEYIVWIPDSIRIQTLA